MRAPQTQTQGWLQSRYSKASEQFSFIVFIFLFRTFFLNLFLVKINKNLNKKQIIQIKVHSHFHLKQMYLRFAIIYNQTQ